MLCSCVYQHAQPNRHRSWKSVDAGEEEDEGEEEPQLPEEEELMAVEEYGSPRETARDDASSCDEADYRSLLGSPLRAVPQAGEDPCSH